MTQPPNPGQPFYQQQPSAPSAPVPGQPYPPQQQFQGAPGAPAAPGAPGAPGQPFPPAQTGDSFMGNFFDTAKPFAEKFGKAGRQRCIDEFSWEQIARETIAVYEKAMAFHESR